MTYITRMELQDSSTADMVVTTEHSLGDMVSGSRKLVDSGNERFPRRY